MSVRNKNILYGLILFVAILTMYLIRNNGNEGVPIVHFTGRTMGSITYNVKYFDREERKLKPQVDSLLKVFNQSLNTYIPGSEISVFNRDTLFHFDLPFFRKSLEVTKELNRATEGAFDPTIMPLVNFWGFGPEEEIKIDSAKVDSLRALVNYDLILFDTAKVWKLNRHAALDFSASAKGYGVDVVAEFIRTHGIKNYFVEIGGEVRTGGVNLEREDNWKVGILDPRSTEEEQFYYATVELRNRSMATSGNYFNYRIVDGVRYSHTISPFTGFPIVLPILSATVVAEDCQSADALATAFMVMGHEKAIEFLNNHAEYEALLIYTSEENGIKHYATDGLEISYR